MQLSQNQKLFSELFTSFQESTKNVESLKKKDDHHRRFLSEILDWKLWGDLNF